MRHVNMQASANTAVVLEPSKPHLTDALCIKGYAPTYGHTLATSMDASNREAKEDVKENNFSWFRRLKHRDEREPSSRDIVTEAVQTISLTERKFTSFDRSEAGSKSAKVVDHPSDTVRSTHFDTLPDSSSTARRQKVVEEDKKYGEDEGHKFEIANGAALNNESVWNSTSASPSFAGFGPWVNVRFNRKQEMDPAATLPAAKTVLTTATSSQMVIKEVREDSSSALSGLLKCSVGSSEAEAAVPPMVLRESVSRMHNKIGLPPRPPSQKNSAFSSPCMNLAPGPTACKGISYPQTVEYQLKEQASPLSAFKALDMHVVQTGKLDDEERPSKIGSSHQRLNAMEGRITASMAPSSGSSEYRAQVLVHTPIRVDKSSISSKEQLWTDANERGVSTGSVYSITRVFDEETRETFSRNKQLHSPYTECSDPSLLNSVRENSRSCLETVSMQKPFEYMLSSLNPSHTIKIESSNTSSTNASMMQALDPERARSTLHMPQGGSGHQRILNADEQSAETSISGALPWDFFVKYSEKSADSAREQFIEAHNRARDELVNQRLHKTSTRVSDGELDGIPKLTLGSSFTISDVRDKRLSTREEQQCSEHMQIQNNNAVMGFKNSNFKSVKAQKDARTSMESDQGKQANVLQLVHSQGSRQRRFTPETAVSAGNVEGASQRTHERYVIQGRVLSSANEEKTFISNAGPIQKEPTLSLRSYDKSSGFGGSLRACQQKNTGRESFSVLGKRSYTTSEDNALSLVNETGSTPEAGPRNKPNHWLQRWYSTPRCSLNSLPVDAQIPSDRKSFNPPSFSISQVKKFGDGDSIGVFGKAGVLGDNTGGLQTSSSRGHPSAAAMAIVGTAARQFCISQPQRKRSSAFWSGFWMPPPHSKDEPSQGSKK